jgi:SAM-dependent methyltransferase
MIWLAIGGLVIVLVGMYGPSSWRFNFDEDVGTAAAEARNFLPPPASSTRQQQLVAIEYPEQPENAWCQAPGVVNEGSNFPKALRKALIIPSTGGDGRILVPYPNHKDAQRMQERRIKPNDHGPTCDDAGLCQCTGGWLFDGNQCVAPGVWEKTFEVLRAKWHEVPYDGGADGTGVEGAGSTKGLVKLTPDKIAAVWEKKGMFTDPWTIHYAQTLAGKRVLDVGAGFARQSLVYALLGCTVTFVDVVQTNLQVIEKLCLHYGISARCSFVYLDDLNTLNAKLGDRQFDLLNTLGSMHHAPREHNRREFEIYLSHLAYGARWHWLSYPSTRWYCGGGGTFEVFCKATDGGTCPWAEWFDVEKMMHNLRPHKFIILFSGISGGREFSWLDAVYLGRE